MDITNGYGDDLPIESKQESICHDCKRTPLEKSDCSIDFCPYET